ncbi:MAG: hypothetical protein AAFU77_18335, partial [Myxococcota bacterium]
MHRRGERGPARSAIVEFGGQGDELGGLGLECSQVGVEDCRPGGKRASRGVRTGAVVGVSVALPVAAGVEVRRECAVF